MIFLSLLMHLLFTGFTLYQLSLSTENKGDLGAKMELLWKSHKFLSNTDIILCIWLHHIPDILGKPSTCCRAEVPTFAVFVVMNNVCGSTINLCFSWSNTAMLCQTKSRKTTIFHNSLNCPQGHVSRGPGVIHGDLVLLRLGYFLLSTKNWDIQPLTAIFLPIFNNQAVVPPCSTIKSVLWGHWIFQQKMVVKSRWPYKERRGKINIQSKDLHKKIYLKWPYKAGGGPKQWP